MNPLTVALLWLARGAAWLGLGVFILVVLALVVLMLALLVPFRFSGRLSGSVPTNGGTAGDLDGGTEAGPDAAVAGWQVHLQWGGPLVQVGAGSGQSGTRLRVLGRRIAQGDRSGRGAGRPQKKSPRKAPGIPLRHWLNRDVFREAALLLKRVWSSLHLRARGDLVLGFEDPSLTGLTAAAMAVVPSVAASDLKVRLDFTRPILEGWGEVEGRGCLGSLVWDLALALLSKPVRRIWGNRFRRWVAGITRRRSGASRRRSRLAD